MIKDIRKIFFVLAFPALLIGCSDDNSEAVDGAANGVTSEQQLQVAMGMVVNSQNRPRRPRANEDYREDCFEALDCFDFVFPVTVDDGVGNQTPIADEDALEDWYDSLDETAEPDFVYPITIENEDGTQQEIVSAEALDEAYEACFDEFECFTINFPISVLDENGNTVEIADETALMGYFDNLPEENEPVFVYPITLTLTEDGSEVTVNDDEQFDEIYGACYGFDDYEDHHHFRCFEIDFPITANDAGGNEVTINNFGELRDYFEGLPEDTDPDINFPITVIFEDDTTEEIGSLEELEDTFDACFYEDEDYDENCIELNYPVTLINGSGAQTVANNEEEAEDFFNSLAQDELFSIGYPVSFTLADGNTQTVNSDDELINLVVGCFGDAF